MNRLKRLSRRFKKKAPSHAESQKYLRTVLDRLGKVISDTGTALSHHNPFELLVATILSAQCTDARVNAVTPPLFLAYPTVSAFANAEGNALEAMIRSTGFYKNKAKAIMGAARQIMGQYGGQVPRTMEELILLPGVGRKTANVILGHAFGLPGIVVDTHVRRVARRLELTESNHPDQIERDLARQMPKSLWTLGSSRLLLHGRHTCRARAPLCGRCALFDLCPAEVEKTKAKRI